MIGGLPGMIAVYSGDRAWRTDAERRLRARGVPVRVASRPAELAKCLADGAVAVVLAGPDPQVAREVASAVTTQHLVTAQAGDSMDDLVERASSFGR